MRISKFLLLSFFLFTILFSACGSPAITAETTEPTTDGEAVLLEAEETIAQTEQETVPEETAPTPIEKTDFVLESVDGQDQYTMGSFSYPAHLGAPKLGMEGVTALHQEGDLKKTAGSINNVADAIHYLMDMEPFTDSGAACNLFVQLLEDNFKDLGTINLRGKNFVYTVAYVRKDNVYYPIDIYNLANGWASWTMLPENGCISSENAYNLCENIAASFPGQTVIESWVMDGYNWRANPENLTKYPFPWELAGSVLSDEEITALYEAGNQYAANRAITTVEDAITYLLMMDPKTRDPHPMKGRPAWKTFLYLIADDYEDVGLINLMKRKPEHREGFYDESAYFGGYYICYVKKDGVYYPVDYLNILDNWTSWTLLPENDCYSSDNLDDLCERMGATFPHHADHSKLYYWEITSYMYHQGIKMIPVSEFLIPEGLGHPVLSDEEIEDLTQETDYAFIAEKITTLGDALHFYDKLRLVKPTYRNSNGYQGFEYFQSAWQVLKDKTAYGMSAASLTRYLLKEDYDEIGYVFAETANMSTPMMYIYEDGLYYLLLPDAYTTEPREDLWIEWPGVIGCAEDFQIIADSIVEHCWFMSPAHCEQVKSLYRFRAEGDYILGMEKNGTRCFPVGTDVTAYYAPDPVFAETTLDWQSQTRIDN